MFRFKIFGVAAASLLLALFILADAEAQSYRYMDSSGNIHFVDRADLVPPQYRQQIPALVTPVVPLTRQQLQEKQRQQNEKQRQIEKQKRDKELQKERERKNLEKQRKKQAKIQQKKTLDQAEQAEEGDFSMLEDKQADDKLEKSNVEAE